MKSISGFTVTEIAVVLVVLAGCGGWVANIVKLCGSGLAVASWSGMEVARIAGIFFVPLGSVLGFF